MSNALSKKFTFWSLLKFALPTIVMMEFMSLYTMVDGVFVSRMVGTSALSAVNIVYPAISFVIAVGIMLATGGSAVIAANMGEGKNQEAKENFTLIVVTGIAAGLLITALGLVFLDPLLRALGANASIYHYCYDYAFVLILFVPLSILQMLFQFFFVTAGKPSYGLFVTILGGLANIVLDYLLIGPADMGIAGAALATGIGYSIPALYGLYYFTVKRKGTLYFVKPKFRIKVLLHSCTNGSSEMVTNLSTAVVTLLFNILMMKYLGEDGVAAITIVLYAQYLLTAIFLGYSSGIAPIISYNYGNQNNPQLQKIFTISMKFLISSSVVIFIIALVFARLIVLVFAPVGSSVYQIAIHGFYLFSSGYLFMGINIFASSLFTALSDGKVSAILSFLRTFVFIAIGMLLLPRFLSVNGIWLAVPIAEVLSILVSAFYIYRQRNVYHYM